MHRRASHCGLRAPQRLSEQHLCEKGVGRVSAIEKSANGARHRQEQREHHCCKRHVALQQSAELYGRNNAPPFELGVNYTESVDRQLDSLCEKSRRWTGGSVVVTDTPEGGRTVSDGSGGSDGSPVLSGTSGASGASGASRCSDRGFPVHRIERFIHLFCLQFFCF
jgi:hypothetical protein